MILDPEIMDFGPRRQTGGNQPLSARELLLLPPDPGSWIMDPGFHGFGGFCGSTESTESTESMVPDSWIIAISISRYVDRSIYRYVDMSICRYAYRDIEMDI